MKKSAAYRKAEQKIEEARHSGATELDLSQEWSTIDSDKLTELPESVGQLTSLQSLDISDNQLTSLPEFIVQLRHLEYLKLSRNNIVESLPESIGQLTKLRVLDITDSKIELIPKSIGRLRHLEELYLSRNNIVELPDSIGNLTQLRILGLSGNPLESLPVSLGNLSKLEVLGLSELQIDSFPEFLGKLKNLQVLGLANNGLTFVPHWIIHLVALSRLYLGVEEKSIGPWGFGARIGNQLAVLPEWLISLTKLSIISVENNQLTDVPNFFAELKSLEELKLDDNPLNPELDAAYKQGLHAVKAYLRAKTEAQIILNEAKLILVGEGGVGKSSLLAALRGDEWIENRKTTHGVEVDIKSMVVSSTDNNSAITLNGWDFGGQNIYRHTHQLFFTAPAIYLVVWDPRRGPEKSGITEWIKLIKHRAYEESRYEERPRILVVATHGGPSERLAHIDEQALRDEFGDLIVGFYHVDSKPDENGVRYHLDELKAAIGHEAAAIPSVGRTVPRSWKNVLDALRKRSKRQPYIHYEQFEKLCNRHGVSSELASTYATILNELGHLIYYHNDENLRKTVILNPEYLSKAVGFVLEDKVTKEAHGLIEHIRLDEIWNNPVKPPKERYPHELHPIFLRLMEKFDLSYQVMMPHAAMPPTSLMAQLVPGLRPEGWQTDWVLKPGDVERTQICRVLDSQTGRTNEAEGLMYRLIVRLHRYSLGRKNYYLSRHWKTGVILDDGYNGRGLIEDISGDLFVTVRAAYPERFLHHLCSEIQWLVEHFWKGLDARLFVPCPSERCKGMLELGEMMDFQQAGMPKVRCAVCKQFHAIDSLMTTMQPKPHYQDAIKELSIGQERILGALEKGFDSFDTRLLTIMSQVDEQYDALLNVLIDPAKDGPRLFSFEPVDRSNFNPKKWTREKFKLTLWCEHRKLPLTALNKPGDKSGVYDIELTREWVQKAAPIVKIISTTLSLALRIAVPGTQLATDDVAYKAIAEQLEFGVATSEALIKGGEGVGDWLVVGEKSDLDQTHLAIRAQGSVLRELHAMLRKADPANGFGGLERVQNKRREFLWVHKQYVSEY